MYLYVMVYHRCSCILVYKSYTANPMAGYPFKVHSTSRYVYYLTVNIIVYYCRVVSYKLTGRMLSWNQLHLPKLQSKASWLCIAALPTCLDAACFCILQKRIIISRCHNDLYIVQTCTACLYLQQMLRDNVQFGIHPNEQNIKLLLPMT